MNIPRAEHPFPQMFREEWINLNGEWEFEIDNSYSGKEKEFFKRNRLDSKINVPFCPESELSSICNKDFMNCVWYRKEFTLPESFEGKRVILHFGAVDYFSTVYINGQSIGEHKGGYSSFAFDISKYIKEGTNTICLCAEDDVRDNKQPTGKQSTKYASAGCLYTRTTGIWQTVWLEAVGNTYIDNFYSYANTDSSEVMFRITINGDIKNKKIKAEVSYNGKKVGGAISAVSGEDVYMTVKLSELHLWDIGCGNLYDVEFSVLEDNRAVDFVTAYFGMRNVRFSEKGFEINGRTVFGRWVLDQGFYPEGIYTAPSDEALKNDIIYSLKLGFNGARLHEKVFEPRYLYWADKLGYLVWGEYPNWGLDVSKAENVMNILPEWIEVMERDFSHPSIIGWCPLNEIQVERDRDLVKMVYDITRKLDPTRPAIDVSGFFHVIECGVYDVHDYDQDAENMKKCYSQLENGILDEALFRWRPETKGEQVYRGEPIFLSEYGGIKWDLSNDDSWGYGNAPKTEEEFLKRYKDLTETIMSNKRICAMCYTQLYDVEQERNGLMTYDRKFKFDPEYFRGINTTKAAAEY